MNFSPVKRNASWLGRVRKKKRRPAEGEEQEEGGGEEEAGRDGVAPRERPVPVFAGEPKKMPPTDLWMSRPEGTKKGRALLDRMMPGEEEERAKVTSDRLTLPPKATMREGLFEEGKTSGSVTRRAEEKNRLRAELEAMVGKGKKRGDSWEAVGRRESSETVRALKDVRRNLWTRNAGEETKRAIRDLFALGRGGTRMSTAELEADVEFQALAGEREMEGGGWRRGEERRRRRAAEGDTRRSDQIGSGAFFMSVDGRRRARTNGGGGGGCGGGGGGRVGLGDSPYFPLFCGGGGRGRVDDDDDDHDHDDHDDDVGVGMGVETFPTYDPDLLSRPPRSFTNRILL